MFCYQNIFLHAVKCYCITVLCYQRFTDSGPADGWNLEIKIKLGASDFGK